MVKTQKNITLAAASSQPLMPQSHSERLFGGGLRIWIKGQKNAALNSTAELSQAQAKASSTGKHNATFQAFLFNQGKKVFVNVLCPGPA